MTNYTEQQILKFQEILEIQLSYLLMRSKEGASFEDISFIFKEQFDHMRKVSDLLGKENLQMCVETSCVVSKIESPEVSRFKIVG